MKITIVSLLSRMLLSCSNQANEKEAEANPFFSEFNTPFNVPPFEKIREEHYLPAYKRGIKQQQQEIEAIVNTPESPTFENTIEAMERSGVLLQTVSSVFGALGGLIANNKIQDIAKEVASLRSKHEDDIRLNEELFERIEAVYDQKSELNLTTEQNTLLEKYYRDFVRSGAKLDEERKARLRAINPNRKIFEARKRETAALGAGEKLVLGHPLAATIGDSARCMQNLEKVLFTGPKTSDTVTFICD